MEQLEPSLMFCYGLQCQPREREREETTRARLPVACLPCFPSAWARLLAAALGSS